LIKEKPKLEIRNPKHETISNYKIYKVLNTIDSDSSLDFTVSNFEFVSNFVLRISNFDNT